MAPASRNISTLTLCQQIGNLFGQHGSSFTEYQHTHELSTDWQFVQSAWLQLHGISAHSLAVNRLAICSVSMAPAARNISTLTPCQQIGNLFGQHGSSFTEYQHTHELSTDWQFVRSAWLQLHGISAHSLPVNRLAISSVSMAPASRNISTLTNCQQIGNLFGQHGSSFTEYQHTHFLSTDWQFVQSAWLQLHGISAHSLPVNRVAICSVSMAPASRNISTLTSCQQIGNLFGQHGSSFTEYQHTHELSTDWQFVRSAWLQLHGISAHSLPVHRLAICSVSMAPASRNISTLTNCRQIGNLFGQHGSSFTEYQHTHELSTDWQIVRSAWLQLHGISAHSRTVNRLAICSVSMAPASRNISTLTNCQQIGNLFGQHGSSFTEYQHTHSLSTDWQFVRSAWLQLHGISAHSRTVNRLAICSVSMAPASRNISTLTSCQQIGNLFGQHGSSFTEYQHTHVLSTDWQFVRSAWLQLHGISAHELSTDWPFVRSAWLQLHGITAHSRTVNK